MRIKGSNFWLPLKIIILSTLLLNIAQIINDDIKARILTNEMPHGSYIEE